MSTEFQKLIDEAKEYQKVLEEAKLLEAELALARAQNPLSQLLVDAGSILMFLTEVTDNVEMAIEQEHVTRKMHKDAAKTYKDAETEWTYDQMIAPVDGKITVDQRKAQVAALLVKAQKANGLAGPYQAMRKAEYAAEDAKMALDQCEKRYSATKAAAELVSSMLNAAK